MEIVLLLNGKTAQGWITNTGIVKPQGKGEEMKATIQGKTGLKRLNLNRRRTIRERCLNCSCWIPKEVEHCTFKGCPLYEYRSGKGRQNAKARDKAIKAYCLWCMGGHRAESAKCISIHCPLFSFRKDRRGKSNPLPKKPHRELQIEANSPI
jgi:hypothetical protein